MLRDPEAQKEQLLKARQAEKLKQGVKCLPQNSCPEHWHKKSRSNFECGNECNNNLRAAGDDAG